MCVALGQSGSRKYLKPDLAFESPPAGLGASGCGASGGTGFSPCVDFPHEVACASRAKCQRYLPQARARTLGGHRGSAPESGDPGLRHPTHTLGVANVTPLGGGRDFLAERRSYTLTVGAVSVWRQLPLNFPGLRTAAKRPGS